MTRAIPTRIHRTPRIPAARAIPAIRITPPIFMRPLTRRQVLMKSLHPHRRILEKATIRSFKKLRKAKNPKANPRMRFTGISTSTEDARWIRSEAEMEVDALKIEGLNRNWRLDFLNSFGSKTNHVSPLAQPFNNLQRFLSSHTLTLRLHPPSRFPHTSASHKSTTNLAFQSSHSTTVILSSHSPSEHEGWITRRSANRRGERRS